MTHLVVGSGLGWECQGDYLARVFVSQGLMADLAYKGVGKSILGWPFYVIQNLKGVMGFCGSPAVTQEGNLFLVPRI